TWLIAAAIFVLALIALKVVRGVLERRLARLVERTKTDIDDLALDLVRKTRFFFPFIVALYAGVQPLALPPT
ncbi:MAG: mechanosensitive ion channel family protein, partial [Acidobacteria bacterium]|nr:mechanosensitive ion channel family protein [Acidobacteriota bacterium]NIT12174.1 mechanosensitive ion channel family protein [Acidobacteriota bacterium]NIT91043.1 mechanosensitive ion channel family protein [Gammaproteobacteria bacterium]